MKLPPGPLPDLAAGSERRAAGGEDHGLPLRPQGSGRRSRWAGGPSGPGPRGPALGGEALGRHPVVEDDPDAAAGSADRPGRPVHGGAVTSTGAAGELVGRPIGQASSRESAQRCFGFSFDDRQENPRRALRPASSLLPVPDRVDAEPEPVCKLLLGHAQAASNPTDIDLVWYPHSVDTVSFLVAPRVFQRFLQTFDDLFSQRAHGGSPISVRRAVACDQLANYLPHRVLLGLAEV